MTDQPQPAQGDPPPEGAEPPRSGARPYSPGSQPHPPGSQPHPPGGQPYPPGSQPYPPGPGGAWPSRELSPPDQRMWSMLAHLSGLAGGLIGLTFVGPLVIYLIFKDRGRFVRDQAAEALNFQILVNVVLLLSIPVVAVLAVVTMGVGMIMMVPVLLLIGVGALVLMILGAVKSNSGELFRYAVNWRLVK